MNSTIRLTAALTIFCSSSVFLLVALALVVPSGYSIGATFLLLPALVYLFVRPYPALNKADTYLIVTLLSYFFVGAVGNYYHHLSSSSFDKISRFLLAIPVLLLLMRFPVKPLYFWSGIACGAIGAGLLSVWNYWIQGAERAAGHTNAIQFGDIAMLFSCILLAVLASTKRYSKWFVLLLAVGIVSGIVASLLSGARGGWLALPATLLMLYLVFKLYKNLKKTVIFLLLLLSPMVLLSLLPQTNFVQTRINIGLIDIQRFQAAADTSTSLGSRLHLWKRGVQMIALHPLAGWGTLKHAATYLDEHGAHDEVLAQYDHVHNEFLDAILKRGVMGGVALLALFLVPALLFYQQWNEVLPSQKHTPLAGLTLILCTAVFGLTQTFFSHTSGVMVYVFSLVILWAQTRTQTFTDVNDSINHSDVGLLY